MNEKLKAAREQKVRERRASEIEREEQKKRWVGVYLLSGVIFHYFAYSLML